MTLFATQKWKGQVQWLDDLVWKFLVMFFQNPADAQPTTQLNITCHSPQRGYLWPAALVLLALLSTSISPTHLSHFARNSARLRSFNNCGKRPSRITVRFGRRHAVMATAGGGETKNKAEIAPVNEEKEGDPGTYNRIITAIKDRNIDFRHLVHDPTPTSKDSLETRIKLGWTDCTLASGAKAMLIVNSKDAEAPYKLAVMAANKKLNWKLFKKFWKKGKGARMATQEEVLKVTGCVSGGVPPFGSFFPVKGVETIVDPSLEAQGERINFNCGLRTRSVSIMYKDYVSVENPNVKTFVVADS